MVLNTKLSTKQLPVFYLGVQFSGVEPLCAVTTSERSRTKIPASGQKPKDAPPGPPDLARGGNFSSA